MTKEFGINKSQKSKEEQLAQIIDWGYQKVYGKKEKGFEWLEKKNQVEILLNIIEKRTLETETIMKRKLKEKGLLLI